MPRRSARRVPQRAGAGAGPRSLDLEGGWVALVVAAWVAVALRALSVITGPSMQTRERAVKSAPAGRPAPPGAPLLRDTELLSWCAQLIAAVLEPDAPGSREGSG